MSTAHCCVRTLPFGKDTNGLEEHLGAVAGTQWYAAKEARDKEMTLAIPLLTGFLLPPIRLEAGS